ncbi:MAG TPA: copper resistance protein NlpE [Candidatus Ornithospirochaeta avicola]|uniref:Copper resistance protein NlpE n=1 Tax=Candidatus Ornithospirochaeta avicola TaxID=2840896 RepID=A0A9D1TML1_9SPIO|nr:copper resistance protein NlpE [Candidatus Ornithospirochaeta avicola]
MKKFAFLLALSLLIISCSGNMYVPVYGTYEIQGTQSSDYDVAYGGLYLKEDNTFIYVQAPGESSDKFYYQSGSFTINVASYDIKNAYGTIILTPKEGESVYGGMALRMNMANEYEFFWQARVTSDGARERVFDLERIDIGQDIPNLVEITEKNFESKYLDVNGGIIVTPPETEKKDVSLSEPEITEDTVKIKVEGSDKESIKNSKWFINQIPVDLKSNYIEATKEGLSIEIAKAQNEEILSSGNNTVTLNYYIDGKLYNATVDFTLQGVIR